jgi:16S rRNA (uracil1498-N3)-methyltransferase
MGGIGCFEGRFLMQRRRFYASGDDIEGSTVLLSKEETHHLAHVLRLSPGDEAYVFDGIGSEYRCKLTSFDGHRARLSIVEHLSDKVESPVCIVLAQALAKSEKFDLVVQKATELGVTEIVPLVTANTDLKLSDDRASKRLERWRRVSLEATKQSGRRTLPRVGDQIGVKEYLGQLYKQRRVTNDKLVLLLFNETGGSTIGGVLQEWDGDRIVAFVGPEGGWTPEEIEIMFEYGVASVTLGPRTLRTETAAIAAVTLIQNRVGDLSR